MQFKLSLVTVALATVVAAIPTGGGNDCNVESQQCCDSVQQAGSYNTQSLQALGLLGIPIGGLNVPIGLTCTPISVLAVQGNSCSAQPVCCSNNNFNGVVALGCTPINVNL